MLFNTVTTSSTFFSQGDDIISPKTKGLFLVKYLGRPLFFFSSFSKFEQAAKRYMGMVLME